MSEVEFPKVERNPCIPGSACCPLDPFKNKGITCYQMDDYNRRYRQAWRVWSARLGRTYRLR